MGDRKKTRRERRIAARQAQILDAAARVFAERGFHRVTTREIAEAADVSEGTLYNYFDSKEDLLVGIMTRLAEVESLDEELVEALQGNVRDFFVIMFRRRTERFLVIREMLQAVLPEVLVNAELRDRYREQFVQRIATMLENYVQARIDLGEIRPVDAVLAALAVQAMFLGFLMMRILGDEAVVSQWANVPEVAATLIFDGLSLPEEV